MSNLIISPKVNEMKPKPTKAQLIEALLIEAKELHKKKKKTKSNSAKKLRND